MIQATRYLVRTFMHSPIYARVRRLLARPFVHLAVSRKMRSGPYRHPVALGIRVFVTAALLFSLSNALLPMKPASAQPGQVEVFDVKQGRVVRQFPLTPQLRQDAEHWVSAISGVVASVNPEPKEGIIVGIPLMPPLQVSNGWVRDTAKVLFVFVNRNNIKHPTLLLINDDNQPLLFQAKVDMQPFLDQYELGSFLQGRSLEIIGQKSRLPGQQPFQLSHQTVLGD